MVVHSLERNSNSPLNTRSLELTATQSVPSLKELLLVLTI